MSGVFVYLDNSNIFHAAQDLAEERNGDQYARYRVRINFENLLRLAHADRPLEKALAAGSIPPALVYLWNRLRSAGVEVHLFDRGEPGRGRAGNPRPVAATADVRERAGLLRRSRHHGAADRRRRRI